jgi:hypothetical protein
MWPTLGHDCMIFSSISLISHSTVSRGIRKNIHSWVFVFEKLTRAYFSRYYISRRQVLYAPWLFHSSPWERCYGRRRRRCDSWDVERRRPCIIRILWNLTGQVKQGTTMTLLPIRGRNLKHGPGCPALQVKVRQQLLTWVFSTGQKQSKFFALY